MKKKLLKAWKDKLLEKNIELNRQLAEARQSLAIYEAKSADAIALSMLNEQLTEKLAEAEAKYKSSEAGRAILVEQHRELTNKNSILRSENSTLLNEG